MTTGQASCLITAADGADVAALAQTGEKRVVLGYVVRDGAGTVLNGTSNYVRD